MLYKLLGAALGAALAGLAIFLVDGDNLSLNAYERVAPTVVRVERLSDHLRGSGVVISEDGLVITAGHVCGIMEGEDFPEMRLVRTDEQQVYGEVLWFTLGEFDVCLIKAHPSDLTWTAAMLRDSRVHLGEEVFTMGYPSGKGFTATRGVVSNPLSTSPVTNTGIISRIQTDAVILPGNSGGPLFDAWGQLIGINVEAHVYQDNWGSVIWNGASYSVPIWMLREIGIT